MPAAKPEKHSWRCREPIGLYQATERQDQRSICETEGHRFESCRARSTKRLPSGMTLRLGMDHRHSAVINRASISLRIVMLHASTNRTRCPEERSRSRDFASDDYVVKAAE